MLLIVRIACGVIVAAAVGVGLLIAWARVRYPAGRGRHQAPAPPARSPRAAPGYTTGSMCLADEETYLYRRDGIVHIDRNGDVDLTPWEVPHRAESAAIWPKTEVINGHVPGCLCPDGDHHWTACPEEEDWPDDDEPPVPPVLGLLPAGPVDEDPGLVDAALALAADDPGDAGWTDQLLADLHDAPTVLDHPPSRLADTGEIELANLRADYAAELRAQYDDTAEYLSRLRSDAAQFRLTVNGL